MFWRRAATTAASASPGREGTLARRASEYLGMSSRAEFRAAATLFMLMLVLRAITITHYKFTTDESQHLHVVWGWARGFMQYRDLADNHMPFFQLLCAPIYALIGDRGSILYWMRLVLEPLYFVAFWCTYRVGSLLFSRRAGIWAVILVGLYPDYLYCSVEYRTDNLWAPLWLLGMVVLLDGAMTMRRALVAGLLIGLCFGVSMKTSLLVMSILAGGTATLLLVGRRRLGADWSRIGGWLAAFFASMLIIPATIMAAFALRGLWPQFRYWVFDHNVLPGWRNHPAWWVIIFPVGFPLIILAARRIVAATPEAAMAARRSFVLVTAGFLATAVLAFWPLVSRQDFLPFYPLAFVICAAALLAISDRFTKRPRDGGRISRALLLPALVCVCELFVAVLVHPFWEDEAKRESNLLRDTLILTEPGDFVLDRKGETVFRQRCFYPVMETLTLERIRRGIIPNDAAQRCVDTRTCVATLPEGMPSATVSFIEQYYLAVGDRLRVAGAFLQTSGEGKRVDFETVIPASYKIIAPDVVVVKGELDGTAYEGEARFLAPGKHTFLQTSTAEAVAALWAQAVDRGFSPFKRSTPSDNNTSSYK